MAVENFKTILLEENWLLDSGFIIEKLSFYSLSRIPRRPNLPQTELHTRTNAGTSKRQEQERATVWGSV